MKREKRRRRKGGRGVERNGPAGVDVRPVLANELAFSRIPTENAKQGGKKRAEKKEKGGEKGGGVRHGHIEKGAML